ncbi:MAG: ABC transporter ATP-binding protein [Pseudonocardia sp.]
MRLSRRLLTLVPAVRWRLVELVVLLLVITATYVGQGILIARVLGAVFAGSSVISTAPLFVGVLALQGVRSIAFVVRESRGLIAAGMVKQELRQRMVDRLLALGPGWLQATRTGTVQATLVDGVETLEAYVARFLPQLVATVIGAVAVTGYVIALDPLVGAIILACALLAPTASLVSRRLTGSRMRAWLVAYRRLYSETLDAVQGMATLKAFNASRRRGVELDREARMFCRDSTRLTAAAVVFVGVVAFAIGIGNSVAVGVGAVQLALGKLDVTELLTILLLARECFRPLNDLEKAYHSSYAAAPAATGILELLDTEPEIIEPAAPVDAARVNRPPSLVFDDVTFSYAQRERPALDGFCLDVAAGERVALVGRSGAGKTTVVSLLLRFFETSRGRVLVDGTDIRDLPLAQLRALVAVVAQDTYLFHGSVRWNLQLARPGAGDAELVAAARAARAHEFIAALPHGYDTVVGERGLTLSGGQRQRIAIARALLSDAPILVLDEATSSVDAANEAGIQQALDTLTGGRTTLVIAHRLSTVRTADRVVVLDAGRVVESGAPDGLLAERGAYARLVAAQEGVR